MPWVIRKAESILEHLEKWKQSENLVSALQLEKLQECNWVRLFVELMHHPYYAASLWDLAIHAAPWNRKAP